MPARAISHQDCVLILQDYATEKFTLKGLAAKYGKSLSSVSKLVNFKSPYLINEFDQKLAETISEIDISLLGVKVGKQNSVKNPVIDYNKIHEKRRIEIKALGKECIELLNSGSSVKILAAKFDCGQTSIRNWVKAVDCNYFSGPYNRPSNNKKHTKESFLIKALEVHGNKYIYGSVEFKTAKDKVKIFCRSCKGYFWQTPQGHMSGKGCRQCAQKRNARVNLIPRQDKIQAARKVHGDLYDYSLLPDNPIKDGKVQIICKEHGQFEQLWGNHVYLANGCPKCVSSKGERQISKILKELNIEFQIEKRFSTCKDKSELPFDFYLPDHNILIEMQGQQHFWPVEIFGGVKGFESRLKRDLIKRFWAMESPYELHCINFDQDIESRLKEILRA